MQGRQGFLAKLKRQYQLYLMLLPAFLLVVVFSYAPLSGWVMAFTNYKLGKSIFAGEWVGFREFVMFFNGTNDAGYTIRNTLVINILNLFVSLTVACAFTVLLNEVRSKKVKRLIQTSSFFPYFVSWVIAYMIFNSFLAVKSGVVNQILVNLGLIKKGINFMGDAAYSWGLILFVNIWKSLGYDSVIFLAALAGIEQEQYEAADIDGASRMQKIWYVTIPGLLPTAMMLLIMNSGWILSSSFEQYYLFSNGSNWETMEVLDLYIYRFGLKNLDFSYATAVGIIKTVSSILLFSMVNMTAKKVNGRSML